MLRRTLIFFTRGRRGALSSVPSPGTHGGTELCRGPPQQLALPGRPSRASVHFPCICACGTWPITSSPGHRARAAALTPSRCSETRSQHRHVDASWDAPARPRSWTLGNSAAGGNARDDVREMSIWQSPLPPAPVRGPWQLGVLQLKKEGMAL